MLVNLGKVTAETKTGGHLLFDNIAMMLKGLF
jgi:hypothetical protein